MPKFPVDAPKRRVVKTLEILGFRMVREREHIAMIRENPDGTKTPLTMPNHPTLKSSTLALSVRKPTFPAPIFCGRMSAPECRTLTTFKVTTRRNGIDIP